MKKMKDDPKEASESEGVVVIDPSGTICGFCNEAFDCLQTMKDLYDALRDQEDRLDEQPEPATEAEEYEVLAHEIRIARTLIGLFDEKAKKLSLEASDGIANLEMMLKAIQDN
jgi:hypothetical protein